MGEAARRKKAGVYPEPALAALRRFWGGRALGAAADFVPPEGTIAITLDVEGSVPSTFVIDATSLVPLLEAAKAFGGAGSYHQTVRTVAKEFSRAKQAGDDVAFQWLGKAALWTAFEHPDAGPHMRAAISADLRRSGKAHISWRFGPAGFALALSDRFTDLAEVSQIAPRHVVTVYRRSAAEGCFH